MKMSGNLQPQMSDQLTLFAEDTPASPFPQPGSAEARRMTATSGRNLIGSWLNSGPLGSLERTLLGTSAWASMTCFLTWRDKVTPAGRLLFQLAPSTPRTGVTGAGLLPTPATFYTRENWTPEQIAERQAEVKAKTNGKGKHHTGNGFGLNLAQAARMWPTPCASDHRDRGGPKDASIQRRKAIGKSIELSMTVDGPLNPEWVEWLMGFPMGWTDLKPSETP